jgi:hypothetical protein
MVNDGGHIQDTDHGSYRWVLASSDGILWEGWGKARGHPVQSFRAEGYGRMTGACFIGHFIRFFNMLKSDDDVVRAIEDLESCISMAITYHWVEGHQDNTKAVGELPWPAQLNVRADELATEAINKQTHTRQAPKLISLAQTSVYLIKGKTTSTSHEVRALRSSIPTKNIKKYLLGRHNWDEKIIKSIAWEAYLVRISDVS